MTTQALMPEAAGLPDARDPGQNQDDSAACLVADYERAWTDLTPRQRDVLVFSAKGLLQKEIAVLLGISRATVETHAQRAVEVMGCSRLIEAAVILAKIGKV